MVSHDFFLQLWNREMNEDFEIQLSVCRSVETRRNNRSYPDLCGKLLHSWGEMDSADAGSVHRLQAGEDVKVRLHPATSGVSRIAELSTKRLPLPQDRTMDINGAEAPEAPLP